MSRRMTEVLILAAGIILVSPSCTRQAGIDSQHAGSPIDAHSRKGGANRPAPLRDEQVRYARTVRALIDSLCTRGSDEDVIATLRSMAADESVVTDSGVRRQIVSGLDRDSSLIKSCLYVADLKRHWKSTPSEHFVFHYQNDTVPDPSVMHRWDSHFERLARTFGSAISEKIPVKIDRTEQYGRAFAPWEVRWGIRQAALNDNPHELVHIMLFEYSDVPFFHEPLAMMYGSDEGDAQAISERIVRYEKTIADSGYVSAGEMLHCPQFIGMDAKEWASAVCFIYQLVKRHDMEKLLMLMRGTPWETPVSEFPSRFREVYGVGLDEFERSLESEVSH